jgi:hypothetical protein
MRNVKPPEEAGNAAWKQTWWEHVKNVTYKFVNLRKDFRHVFTPIPIFTDNQSYIMLNDINNNWKKHINRHFHYTHNQVSAGNI